VHSILEESEKPVLRTEKKLVKAVGWLLKYNNLKGPGLTSSIKSLKIK
jgi:hypothetical protein